MAKLDLKTKLDDLQLRATESSRLTNIGRQHLYRTFAKAYFYWRECQTQPEFLEKQYQRAQIESRDRKDNKINFRPFVKLVFNISGTTATDNNRASHWGKVLRKLDELYTQSPKKYEVNGEGIMALDIHNLGGITNIVIEDNNEADPADTPSISAKDTRELARKKLSENELAQRGRLLLTTKGVKGIGTATTRSNVRTDGDNLVAMIGRRESDGSITLLGTTNQAEAVDALAIHATKRNYHLVPESLRQIGEVLSIPLFPYGAKPKSKAAASAWEKRILYDQIGTVVVKAKKAGDKDAKVPIATPRRLLIRGTKGDIIYSNMRLDCCVVTRCTPTLSLAPKTKNIYLKTEERKHIDSAIDNGDFELMTTTTKSSLASVKDELHEYVLKVSNPYNSFSRTLHFYLQGRQQDGIHNWQGDFNFGGYKANWKAKIGANWLMKFRAEFLDEWFSTLGRNTQIKRENNFTFDVRLTENEMTIRFNIGELGPSPFRNFPLETTLPRDVKFVEFSLRSKDCGPILFNLADTAVNGAIAISGNEQALLIGFKTDMGSYQIAIPTEIEYKRPKTEKEKSLFLKGA